MGQSHKIPQLFSKAVTLHKAGQVDEAEVLYKKILALQPENTQILESLILLYVERGDALLKARHYDEAVTHYDNAIALKSHNANAHNNRGLALQGLRRFHEALASYDQALMYLNTHPDIYDNRGNVLRELGHYDEALASYDKALMLKPDHIKALFNRSITLQTLKRFDEALASYDKTIAMNAAHASVHSNRGIVLHKLKRYDEAMASFERALTLQPDYADAYYNLGVTLQARKHLDRALPCYQKAISLHPGTPAFYNNLGIIFNEMKHYDEALASYDKAIAIKRDYADAYNNRGLTLQAVKRLDEALANYDKAIVFNPNNSENYNNRGNVLHEMKRYDEALASYSKAIALQPDYAMAYSNRGNTFREILRYDESVADLEKAWALQPDIPYLMGTLLYAKLCQSRWQGLDAMLADMATSIEVGETVCNPFVAIAVPLTLKQRKQCTEMYAKDRFLTGMKPLWQGQLYTHSKIRIAYVSADFCEHPLSFLMSGLFERHDRAHFEIYGISLIPENTSPTGQRVKAAFDMFIDVSNKSDQEVAQLLRDLEIDIAVDLMGFTQSGRTNIFAYRPAPVHINYLGYPATMGTEYMDYILADRFVIPPQYHAYYTEHVVYMPDCYQVNDDKRFYSEQSPSRANYGLPEQAFVFCVFSNSYKIMPAMFAVWMRLLSNVDGSVLWLLGDATIECNLRAQAESRGVDPSRLIFTAKVPYQEHLIRLKAADLFLDTLPFNAGATASDVLWMGLPMVTCTGDAFAARMAGSLLTAIGLPELITHTLEEYEALAIVLATQPERLAAIRTRLARNRTTHSLFNTDRFRQHLERAYQTMVKRYQDGLPPESFTVEP